MEADTVAPATPTETPTPPVVESTEPAPELSVSEHEAQFGPNRSEPAPEVSAEPKRRHRQKDIATPGDVPEQMMWEIKAPDGRPRYVPIEEQFPTEPLKELYRSAVKRAAQVWADRIDAELTTPYLREPQKDQ